MPNRELTTSTRYVQLTEPQTRNAAFRSAYVDLQGWDAVDIVIDHGDVTAAAGANTLTATLQEDDGAGLPTAIATYGAVAAADRTGAFTVLGNGVTTANSVVGYRGGRRYIHVNVALAGASSAVIGITAVLRKFSRQPSNTAAVTTGAVV